MVALLAILTVIRVVGTGPGNPGAGGAAGWAAAPAAPPPAAPSSAAPPADAAASAAPPPAAPSSAAPPSGELTAAAPSDDVLVAEPPDWWAVLAELDRRRARALAARDLDLLADYAQPGSAAWEADAAVMADLRERGLRPTGLTSRVLALERVERQGRQATLQIVDQRVAYTVVDADDAIVADVEPAGPTRWSVTLAQGTDDQPGWRVVDSIQTAGSGGTGTGPAPVARE